MTQHDVVLIPHFAGKQISANEDGVNSVITIDQARELLDRARAAAANAYAPFSHFPVGAALLARDGSVFAGVNVENSSYGLTNCAERSAIFSAVSAGVRDFVAVAICAPAAEGEIATPCGACRQVLWEFLPGDAPVIIPGLAPGDPPRLIPLKELLPLGFKL